MPSSRLLLVALLFFCSPRLFSQAVFVLDSLPAGTPAADTIFMASTLNCWATNDPQFAFRPVDGRLMLTIPVEQDSFSFRLTRGTWQSVEAHGNATEAPVRFFAHSNADTVYLKVCAWRDMVPKKQMASTATKSVRFLPTIFEIPQLDRKRTIRLYLPPNYSSGKLFPVIYMHDGQNLFDNATSVAGEWKVDEILDSLHTYRGFSAIVVAIYSDENERINEYSPWKNDSLAIRGEGEKYAKFIVNTLKPFIDRHYRTLSGRESTAIMGSEMGGVVSLYTALEYPEVFGMAAVFSPSVGVAPKLPDFVQKYKRKKIQQLYLVAGEKEGDAAVAGINSLLELLKGSGFNDEYYMKVRIAPDGRSAEWFWSREFGNAVRYLFKF